MNPAPPTDFLRTMRERNQGATVLIVDDNLFVRQSVTRLLESAGYHVAVAATGQEGLATALARKPDLVLLDVNLPDINGIEVCRRLKTDPRLAGMLVVHLSATEISSESQVYGLVSGADGYIAQPVRNEELLARVDALVRIKRSEEALGRAEARYRALVEQIPVITYTAALDAAGTVQFISPQVEPWLGYAPAAFQADPQLWRKKIHPADLTRVLAAVAHCAATGAPLVCEYRLRTRQDCEVWLRDEGVIVRDAAGQPVGRQGVLFDITERKLAAEQLQESEMRFRQLAETIQEVFWISSVDKSQMFYVSPGYEKIWGHTCKSLYEQPGSWIAAVHPEDRPRVTASVEKQIRGEFDEEYRILTADGAIRWVRDRAFPVRDAAGEVYRLAGLAEDITDRKRLEIQFLQAQKMECMGRLAGGVAHDFNNILTVITSYAGFAQDTLAPEHPVRKDIDQILRATDHAIGLTRQLLIFSRKQIFQPQVVSLHELVKGFNKMLRCIIGEDVEVVIRNSAGTAVVRIDPVHFEQILVNLAVNARDAMPKGGTLTLETVAVTLSAGQIPAHSTVVPGDYSLLVVSDTGEGMTDEVKSRIFEPFFTTKAPGKGTGLGLATVYGIVKQNGGHIEVVSQVHEGATFKIFLPMLAEPAGPASPESSAGQPAQGSERILVVEDEVGLRTLMAMLLRRQGYQVLEAANGLEALQIAGECGDQPLDLVVIDLVLPKLGGVEVMERLRSLRAGCQFLLISGYTDEHLSVEQMREQGIAFLQKPFKPEALRRKVREVLDAHKLVASP